MSFSNYLNQAWNEHATDPVKVSQDFGTGIVQITSRDELIQMAQLICHVMGEHLGEWQRGIEILNSLNDSEAVKIQASALQISSGDKTVLKFLQPSEKIRALAIAASALADRDTPRASNLFLDALSLTDGLSKEDPANRSLAVTGNNLASALEEKPALTDEQKNLMLMAAEAGRKFWEIAGNWMHAERAEYRLAKCHLKASQPLQALKHSKNCLHICEKNQAQALEFFFGYEVMALSEKNLNNLEGYKKALEQMQNYFKQLSEDDQSWCKATLDKTTA